MESERGAGAGGVTGRAPLDAAVRAVLSQIHDPCSVAAGRPTSLLDMGLVLGWALGDGGVLRLDLCVTFAGCTMGPHFAQAAADALARIEGVARVDVRIDTAFAWTPDRMADPAPVRMTGAPQAWRTRHKSC